MLRLQQKRPVSVPVACSNEALYRWGGTCADRLCTCGCVSKLRSRVNRRPEGKDRHAECFLRANASWTLSLPAVLDLLVCFSPRQYLKADGHSFWLLISRCFKSRTFFWILFKLVQLSTIYWVNEYFTHYFYMNTKNIYVYIYWHNKNCPYQCKKTMWLSLIFHDYYLFDLKKCIIKQFQLHFLSYMRFNSFFK